MFYDVSILIIIKFLACMILNFMSLTVVKMDYETYLHILKKVLNIHMHEIIGPGCLTINTGKK